MGDKILKMPSDARVLNLHTMRVHIPDNPTSTMMTDLAVPLPLFKSPDSPLVLVLPFIIFTVIVSCHGTEGHGMLCILIILAG